MYCGLDYSKAPKYCVKEHLLFTKFVFLYPVRKAVAEYR